MTTGAFFNDICVQEFQATNKDLATVKVNVAKKPKFLEKTNKLSGSFRLGGKPGLFGVLASCNCRLQEPFMAMNSSTQIMEE